MCGGIALGCCLVPIWPPETLQQAWAHSWTCLIADYKDGYVCYVQAETSVDAAMHTGANKQQITFNTLAVVHNARSLVCCSFHAVKLYICIRKACNLLDPRWHPLGSIVTSAAVAAAEGVTACALHSHVAASLMTG